MVGDRDTTYQYLVLKIVIAKAGDSLHLQHTLWTHIADLAICGQGSNCPVVAQQVLLPDVALQVYV